jgi:L-lactate dehydrogenase complex protein LldG
MDLIDQFEQAAIAAAATVQRVSPTGQAVAQAVSDAAEARGPAGRRIAVAASQDLPAELLDGVRQLPGVFAERSKTALASADVGVTEAFAGVASTGSICVSVDHEYTGAVSLLAPLHIAVLDGRSIVTRPSDLLSPDWLGGIGLRRSYVFVTGPSATADMGPLVRGVHGPHRLHILLLV